MTISPERARRACDVLAAYCAAEPWCNSAELRATLAELCQFVHERTAWMGEDAVDHGTSPGRMVVDMWESQGESRRTAA